MPDFLDFIRQETQRKRKRQMSLIKKSQGKLKYEKGDLVASYRAGGFGESAAYGAKAALVLNTDPERGYELHIIEGMGREWRPASFVGELSEEHRKQILPRLTKWLQDLESRNLKEWFPTYEVREALRIALGGKGKGPGHWGHKGRPGERGGSLPG